MPTKALITTAKINTNFGYTLVKECIKPLSTTTLSKSISTTSSSSSSFNFSPIHITPVQETNNTYVIIKDHRLVASTKSKSTSTWKSFLLGYFDDYFSHNKSRTSKQKASKQLLIENITTTWTNNGGIFVTPINNGKYKYEANPITKEDITRKSLQYLNNQKNTRKRKLNDLISSSTCILPTTPHQSSSTPSPCTTTTSYTTPSPCTTTTTTTTTTPSPCTTTTTTTTMTTPSTPSPCTTTTTMTIPSSL